MRDKGAAVMQLVSVKDNYNLSMSVTAAVVKVPHSVNGGSCEELVYDTMIYILVFRLIILRIRLLDLRTSLTHSLY